MSGAAYRQMCSDWKDRQIRCPFCLATMTFGHYRKEHAPRHHDMDEKTTCLFCPDFRWRRGSKGSPSVSSHLHACLKAFTSKTRREARTEQRVAPRPVARGPVAPRPVSPLPVTPRPADDEPTAPVLLCSCVNFDSSRHRRLLKGRAMNQEHRRSGFYDNVLWNESFWRDNAGRDVAFDAESGLGFEAAVMVRLFERGDWKFYHVILWSDVFADYLGAMRMLEESFQATPFWCLCDGHGAGRDAHVHRHAIVLTNDEPRFVRLWSRIQTLRDQKRRYEIKNLKHLSNLVRYVSQEKSTCDGVRTNVFSAEGQNHHFYINRPVYPHALVALFSLWRGGMGIYAIQKLKKRNVVDWPYEVCKNDRRRVRLKETGIVPRNCVVPLRPDFKPDPEGLYELHLSEGRCLKYSLDGAAAVIDRGDRLRFYASRGNLFMNAEDEAYYVLNQMQRAQVTCIDTIKARIRMENDERFNAMIERMDAERERTDAERVVWQTKMDGEREKMDAERLVLQTKMDGERVVWQTKIDRERVSWQSRMDAERVSWQSRLDEMSKRLARAEAELLTAEWRLKYERCETENRELKARVLLLESKVEALTLERDSWRVS